MLKRKKRERLLLLVKINTLGFPQGKRMNTDKLSKSISIQLNVPAPTFNLIDIFDREINLENFRGKKVFIGFFRHAGCPFCNLRIRLLQKLKEELSENNLEMIFFFESTKERLLDSNFHRKVNPIPIISDPQKEWYQVYGVQESLSKALLSHLTSFIQTAIKATVQGLPVQYMRDGETIKTMPAEFLLDENLVLRKLHYSSGLNDRMEVEEIVKFAKS